MNPTKKKGKKTVKNIRKIKKIQKIFARCEYEVDNTIYEKLYTALKGIKKQDRTFFNFGSGIGEIAISISILYPQIKQIVGIEFSKNKVKGANKILKTLPQCYNNKIKFTSSLNINLKDANLIWISETEHLEKILEKINKEAKRDTYIFSECPITMDRAEKAKNRYIYKMKECL
ncbi:hypothetical protein [uncultured Mediterranean phage]|nr:hypothetical protein [uncultured Mediterranean phage]